MTRHDSENLNNACLTLSWSDVQEMLAGHHPLLLLKMVMHFEILHNPPTLLELGDQLSNAEYLCGVLGGLGIKIVDLTPIANEIYELTRGLSFVADDVVSEIITMSVRKGLGRGCLRRKSLMDSSMVKPIKRDVPLARGANYADPENKAFPLDTPERVRASHAYIHKFWNSAADSGIMATYNRDKFIQVHNRILTRMRRLGIEHTHRDSLDRATRALIKKRATEKAASLKKAGRGGVPRDGGLDGINPELMDANAMKRIKNLIQSALSDHISFLKNYISACDERNDGVAKSMETALEANTAEITGLVKQHLTPYSPDEAAVSQEDVGRQFVGMWQEYLDAVKSMVIGGDTGNESMSKSGLRTLFLVKDKIVKFCISLLAEVAEEEELDAAWTDWVKYLQGYIEARDNDNFAASYQYLLDWKTAKDTIAKKMAFWIIGRDNVNKQDFAEAKPLDVHSSNGVGSDVPNPATGEVTNPPPQLEPAIKAVNNVRRQAASASDAGASGAGGVGGAGGASVPAASDSGANVALEYPPKSSRRLNETRQLPVGHRPHGGECIPDARNGKCYIDHGRQHGRGGK